MMDQKKHEWLMEYLSISPDARLVIMRNDEFLTPSVIHVAPLKGVEIDELKEMCSKFPFTATIGTDQPEICAHGKTPEQAMEILVTALQSTPGSWDRIPIVGNE
jgi:hypothetical protein